MNRYIPVVMLAIATALLATSAQAAPRGQAYFVTPAQLEAIHAGQTRDDVVKLLGQPEYTPKWQDGTYSLAYETLDINGARQEQAYVDIDAATGKVLDVSYQSQN